MIQEARLDEEKLLELGLLDTQEDGSLVVHDWDEYNAPSNTQAMRQKRYRMRRAGIDEATVLAIAPPSWGSPRDVTRDVTTTSHSRAYVPVPSRNTLLHKPGRGFSDRAEGDAPDFTREDAGDVEAGEGRALLPQVDGERYGW